MPRPFYRSELVGAELVWLLDLTFAGRVWRLASETVEVLDADGTSLAYLGAFAAPVVRDQVEVPGTVPGETTASFDVRWPGDIAELVAQGHRLREGRADLSLWIRGTEYEDRQRVILDGRVVAPQYGEEGEPVRFSVAARPYEDRATFPPAAAVISEVTWPNRGSRADGLVYPWVFGAPGVTAETDGTAQYVGATPAHWVDTDTLLIAGHEVAATSVTVVDADGLTESFSVDHVEDGLGRLVAVVDLTGAATITVDEGADYWIQWRAGGGVLKDDRSAALESALELVLYMLRWSTLAVDVGRLRAGLQAFGGLKLAGYIDEPVSPWQWVQDNVLPLLPVSMAAGAEGVYAIPWRLGAREGEAVEAITVGPGFARASLVTEEDDELVTDLSLAYAVEQGREYRRKVLITSEDYDADEPNALPSMYARNSALRHGRHETSLETDLVYDPATASAIAAQYVRARAFPVRTVEYEADVAFAWLQPGDVVAITETGLHWADVIGVVTTRTWLASGRIGFVVTFWEDPPRDTLGAT